MEKEFLEFLLILLAGLGFLVWIEKRILKVKNYLNGMKFGVIIINPVLNNRNKIFEGFIERELIKKGAKAAPVGLRILECFSRIEDLKNTTFYHKEKLDFLIVGELETESKEVIIKTLDLNKNPNQEILDSPEFIKKRVKAVKYSLNFKIFDCESRLYTGTGYAEIFKLLDDSINPIFEKISKDIVNSIYIDNENKKFQKTLVEKNVKNNSKQ